MTDDGIYFVEPPPGWRPPPIPTRWCCICGAGWTSEVQYVRGVAHAACYHNEGQIRLQRLERES